MRAKWVQYSAAKVVNLWARRSHASALLLAMAALHRAADHADDAGTQARLRSMAVVLGCMLFDHRAAP